MEAFSQMRFFFLDNLCEVDKQQQNKNDKKTHPHTIDPLLNLIYKHIISLNYNLFLLVHLWDHILTVILQYITSQFIKFHNL